jgi:hypothetical protein
MFTPMTWSSRPRIALIATGIGELVLAGVFLLFGLAIPTVRGGFILTAAILGAVGIGLLGWGMKMQRGYREAQRLKVMGKEGTARVAGMTQTGTTLNDNPLVELDLEVTIPGRPPYRVTHREWVPLVMLGTLTMGAALHVRVDPADPSKLMIEWDKGPTFGGPFVTTAQTPAPAAGGVEALGGLAAAALAGLASAGLGSTSVTSESTAKIDLSEAQADAARLLAAGVDGHATITAVNDTGVSLMGQRLFVLDLLVNVPGRAPHTVNQPSMVPEASVGKAVVGTTVPIKADAADTAKFAIDWARA